MKYDAAFYDKAMTEKGAPSMLPLHKSPWRPLYVEAAHWIGAGEHVIDLGCGTGRFAAQLACDEFRHATYHGVDFSREATREAYRYARREISSDPEGYTYEVADLTTWQADRMTIAGNTVFTCLEVLEHLDDDLTVIRNVPPGHRIIFSVPNYDSEAHVRCFEHVGDVWARFTAELDFTRWTLIRFENGRAIHLLDTTRRPCAW